MTVSVAVAGSPIPWLVYPRSSIKDLIATYRACLAVSPMAEVETAALFRRRMKRAAMVPTSMIAPTPTNRCAASTNQCQFPTQIICCVTPKIGTISA